MNKKILFLILLLAVLSLPLISQAITLLSMVEKLSGSLQGLGAGLATIGFIIAGITYIASTANPSMMSVAKTALVAAVIGIVIVLLAPTAADFIGSMFGVGGGGGAVEFAP